MSDIDPKIFEYLCRALCAIEKDLPVDQLCYNFSTDKKDMPAWEFRRSRVEEMLLAIQTVGGVITFPEFPL